MFSSPERTFRQAEMYVPSVAHFPNDLRLRYDLLRPAREQGFQTGFMLVLGANDFSQDRQQKQLDNLALYAQLSSAERPRVFGMHSNTPLDGPNRLNLLNNHHQSQEHLEQSITLIAQLPHELTPQTGKMLSFHLNTLIKPSEWKSDEEYWQRAFEEVLRNIQITVDFGKRNNVAVAIETTPIPEFGDVAHKPSSLMDDGHTYWRELGNPWPLLFWRDEVQQLRNTGAQLAIDFCHSYIALRTVRQIAKLPADVRAKALLQHMLFERDLDFGQSAGSLSEQILKNTQAGDVWHVNDGAVQRLPKDFSRDKYTQQAYFEEGIALFEGNIPVRGLQKLIREGLKKPIKFTIETHETDFQNSPHTRKSLDKVLGSA
jgi:hypothetical protein